MSKPLDKVLLIPLGDPRSINLQLLAQSAQEWPEKEPYPIVLIGSWAQWNYALQTLTLPWPKELQNLEMITTWPKNWSARGRYFFDVGPKVGGDLDEDPRQLPDKQCGEIAWKALQEVSSVAAKRLAVVTLPIAKYRAQQGGMPFPGQTEFFEDIWQGEAVMLLAGPKLRVGLATNHHPLASVSRLLSVEMLVTKMVTLARSLKLLLPGTVSVVRLGVCGLNPHASDHGLFGDEEARVIAPAIARAQEKLRGEALISGPLPADTAFFHATQGQYDAILAMYHDQGLGPLKLIHFSDAINVSLGLQHLRVAPDHGPAEDLYGTTRGDASSLSACFAVARRYLAENG